MSELIIFQSRSLSRTFLLTHVLLSNSVIIIEGLDRWCAPSGRYELICLPLRIGGGSGDGRAARAVLRTRLTKRKPWPTSKIRNQTISNGSLKSSRYSARPRHDLRQIAELLGEGYTPRTVGFVMHASDDATPWHRVLNARGACSTVVSFCHTTSNNVCWSRRASFSTNLHAATSRRSCGFLMTKNLHAQASTESKSV